MGFNYFTLLEFPFGLALPLAVILFFALSKNRKTYAYDSIAYGVGAFLGGAGHHIHYGIAGVAKFGVLFKKVPIRLSIDYTPQLGLASYYHGGGTHFHGGWANFGVSAAYCFRQKK